MENIAIIGGTGGQGFGLALRWALDGRPVILGSRDQARAAEAADRLQRTVREHGRQESTIAGMENAAAAASSTTVVVAVPLEAQAATARAIKGSLQPGALVIDVTVPLATAIGGRASRLLGLPAGSAAQQLAEYLPSHVQIASGFHFLSADLLADPGLRLDCDVVCCGGDAAAQSVLRELVEAIPGASYFHAGPLAASALVEAAATMLIAINIRHKSRTGGLRLTGITAPERSQEVPGGRQ